MVRIALDGFTEKWDGFIHGLVAKDLLGVEPDYLLYSKVPPHWTPVQNGGGNAAHKIFTARGVQGGGRGQRLLGAPPGGGVSGAAPPKLKTVVKLPCKSTVISSQSGLFIRQMI